MPDTFEYDVFLSHNSTDKPRVRSLAERLKKEGLRVWFDEWVIKPGDDIYLAVERGLQTARVQILCLSPAALGSGWVTLERSTVLFRDPVNAGRRFIPVLLTDCELPDALRRYKYVDFRKESDAVFAELIAACRTEAEPVPTFSQPRPKTKQRRPKKIQRAERDPQVQPLAVLEREIKGDEWPYSVMVSPDGKSVASGSEDGVVRIWDLATGARRAMLKGHKSSVKAVTFTPDGKLLLSGSDDNTIRVWDAADGRLVGNWVASKHMVLSLAVLSDGRRVISGGAAGDPNFNVWDIANMERLREFQSSSEYAKSLSVSADNQWAVSDGQRGIIRLWNVETGECIATLRGHSNAVRSVRITPDGEFAISGSDDSTIKVWNLKSGSCIGTLEGHQGQVMSVALSPDCALIASAGFTDHTTRLWDWKSGACMQVIRMEGASVPAPISVAFSPDGSRLVVGTAYPSNGRIYVYTLADITRTAPIQPARRYVNAKVVLIGEGTVGKTSLSHRLIEDRYVVRDRTHGMNVWRMDLPLPADETLEREALLWDLAGQEDYRLIHQLFLDETALALLLVNPQKDDPFAETGDWLKSLKAAVGGLDAKRDVAKALIFSQIDVGGMKVGNAKIDRFREQHGFAGCLATSAKTGENCSDKAAGDKPSALKQLIASSIPWDKLPWTSTPRLLAELKNAVVAMRDTSDIRLLRFPELEQRLKQALPAETFGESDVRTAVTLLANHGLARPLKFGDLVLLRPDLLNGYAGAIIRAARAHKDEIGCVSEGDIYKPEFDFTGVERLGHRPDEELLLRALVQTFLDNSLCIAEETPHGRHLVFPSQYRREKDIPKDPDIFVSYSFGGEWQTVWTTLVVRLWYSQEFEHRELWRNAAEFASNKGHTLGMVVRKTGDGDATISLFFDVEVPDELKVIFIEYVHRHLARYACDVVRDRRYVCPDCRKPVTDLQEVRNRLEVTKKDFITCQGCDAKVPLIDFIEQRLKSDPVARKILAMDATATRELDTQALEQILIGHMMAISGEANQIFRELTKFDYGIDGELEFKDNDGNASGKKIYVQLKSGNSYLRTRKADGHEIFDVKNERHLDYWVNQPVDVYLVIRQKDEKTGHETIRWMNVTRYLKGRKDKSSRQITFEGEKLDMEAVWRLRDAFFPPSHRKARGRP